MSRYVRLCVAFVYVSLYTYHVVNIFLWGREFRMLHGCFSGFPGLQFLRLGEGGVYFARFHTSGYQDLRCSI